MTREDFIKIRKDLGHTQESIAYKLGVSVNTVRKWEAKNNIKIPHLASWGIKAKLGLIEDNKCLAG